MTQSLPGRPIPSPSLSYCISQTHLGVCGVALTVADLLEAVEGGISKRITDSIRRHLLNGPGQRAQASLCAEVLLLGGSGVVDH